MSGSVDWRRELERSGAECLDTALEQLQHSEEYLGHPVEDLVGARVQFKRGGTAVVGTCIGFVLRGPYSEKLAAVVKLAPEDVVCERVHPSGLKILEK